MTTYIDDQDFSKVNYTGTWIRGGSTKEYDETVASSTNVGDYLTVSFRGTNIAVFGTFDITSKGVVTTYSVDGAPPAQVTSQAGSGDTHRQQFWRSDSLAIGEHKLVVNMSRVNFDPQPGEGTVWFDYFLVTDPTITSSGSPAPSPAPSQSGGHKSVPVGAIVGAVIGGLFFLLAVACLLFLYRRRARIQIIEETVGDDKLSPASGRHKRIAVQPFVLTMADVTAETSTSTSAEFNPALLVSGPPPTGARKSVVTVRPSTGHSTQSSIGNRTDATSHEPPTPAPEEPPVPPLPSTSASGTAGDTTHASELETPAKQKTRRLQVDVDALPSVPPISGSRSPESSLPLQHIDSGVRAANLTMPEGMGGRIELPPVYSPV
ncbi:hypothetical protein LshimejAT787_0900960 [Lyophyllum shimeji]|uniref:Uncharacterized protein n=1 Tax=Lyophyllum shimeji TaxID=47721 RepID=A0A9P3PSF1_LYOSH|nr:hypothetical protein LshimejAT787_0900960 [Lyophyllum shimeji]